METMGSSGFGRRASVSGQQANITSTSTSTNTFGNTTGGGGLFVI